MTSQIENIENAFWSHHGEAPSDEIRQWVEKALAFSLEEGNDPLVDTRIDDAVQAMVETQPSWGHRLMRVWGALGHDFGDADSLNWGMQREFTRLFSYDPDAVKAIQNGTDYPPLGKPIR